MSEDGETGATTGGGHPIGSAQTLPARPQAAADQLTGKPPPAEDLEKQIVDWIKQPWRA